MLNAAMRFRNKNTYSIVGLGTPYLGFDKDFSGALYYRIGRYASLSPRLTLSADVGFYHIETFKKEQPLVPARLFSLQTKGESRLSIHQTARCFRVIRLRTHPLLQAKHASIKTSLLAK